MGSKTASIKFYTNHRCPWAHRAYIALQELGVDYEEIIIDLDTPRTPEYLAINPRGQVPTLIFNGETIRESAIVAEFLAAAFPGKSSSLLPAGPTPEAAALARARIAFFVDAWFTRVNGFYHKALFAKTDDEAAAFCDELAAAVKKEIEPLLLLNGGGAGAGEGGPFFGGSARLTLAEALTAPFVLRLKTFAKHGLLPASLGRALEEETPAFHRWSEAVIREKSVNGNFDEEVNVARFKERIAKARANV